MTDDARHPSPDDLDQRASDVVDGVADGGAPATDPGPDVDARAAAFEVLRGALRQVPAPPAGALDQAVAAALAAYDEDRAAIGPSPPSAPVVPLRRRRGLGLAPLGAAAAIAAVLGVAALAARDGDGGDAAQAPTAVEEATTRTGAASATQAAPDLATDQAGEPSSARATPPASLDQVPALGSFATLEELAASRQRDELVEAEAATPERGDGQPTTAASPAPPGSAPEASRADALTPAPCAPDAVALGTAQLAGQQVVVVERPGGSLAAFDAECRLVDEAPPPTPPTTR